MRPPDNERVRDSSLKAIILSREAVKLTKIKQNHGETPP